MKLSIGIPVYNEADALPLLLAELRPVLDGMACDYEIIFVNDGSQDGSLAFLMREAAADSRIKILNFSRNFGQQTAVTAAIDFCTGDAVVILDADLQDPPDLLPEMVRLYREGFDVVSPQRVSRDDETWFKRKSAALFYALIRKLTDDSVPAEVGDFRLLSRAAILALREFREQDRFVRGMVAWLGLREALLPFDRRARAAGRTKYTLWNMVRLSWTAITSFSGLPLRLSMLAGVFATVVAILSLLYAAYSFYRRSVVPGWTSLVFMQSFFFGVTFLCLGIMGQYVARIYEESKSRPLYVLKGTMNIDPQEVAVKRAIVLPARSDSAGASS